MPNYEFESALLDAANWTQFIKNEYERNMPFETLQDLCVQRCLLKHEKFIDELEATIKHLEDDNDEMKRENNSEERRLQDEIGELEEKLDNFKNIIPNNNLNDVEKIELLNENWDKFTYGNLKEIITPNKQKDSIISELNEEITSLTYEINELNDQIESLEERLYNKHN